jgi:hypothetical protein
MKKKLQFSETEKDLKRIREVFKKEKHKKIMSDSNLKETKGSCRRKIHFEESECDFQQTSLKMDFMTVMIHLMEVISLIKTCA